MGNEIQIEWSSDITQSLSCLNCPNPIVTPLSDHIYTIHVSNDFCKDSAHVEILVDETRRVFFPNTFSPDADGFNDYFYFQSPDPGSILSLDIYNRWGALIYSDRDLPINEEQSGWNGRANGALVEPGVYVWQAEILFFDGKKKMWTGDITVEY